MTVRELSRAQRRLMDVLIDRPDSTDLELAAALGWSDAYVSKLLRGVFATYRVHSRTGAAVVHLRRTNGKRRPKAEPQPDTLGLA